MEHREELIQLRAEIAQKAQEMALSNEGSSPDRLRLIMDLIQAKVISPDLVRRAYELSLELPDGGDQFDNIIALLDEVDAYLEADRAVVG